MQDDLKKFSQAVLAGIRGGDTNAGTGNSIVDNFAKSSFGSILAGNAGGVGTMAGSVADQQAREAEMARQKAAAAIKDKLDPGKYQKVRKNDGGFDFLDPNGNPISVAKYAAVNGTTPFKVLADSDNPFDRQYVNDYANTGDLVQAIQNGDTDKISSYKSENEDISKMTPDDLMKELIRRYPHIYGNGTYQQSFANNNKPVLRYNLGGGMTSSTAGASGSSTSSGTRNWK